MTVRFGAWKQEQLQPRAQAARARYDRADPAVSMAEKLLNAEKALIFRITHIDNVPWILDHGLHCRNSSVRDPGFREIGNRELIAKRLDRPVPCVPGTTLSDYVPFYFTPWSPMQMNIVTGYRDTPRTPAREIVFLVSSVPKLDEHALAYVLTDRHAYMRAAEFSTDASGLSKVDWPLLQSKDFKRSDADPGRVERYQAEALVRGHVPVEALIGIAVHDAAAETRLKSALEGRKLAVTLAVRAEWFFR